MEGIKKNNKPKKEKIYMAVTADTFEFPLGVFENIKNLAKWANISTSHVRTIIRDKSIYKKQNCKFIEVFIEEGAGKK